MGVLFALLHAVKAETSWKGISESDDADYLVRYSRGLRCRSLDYVDDECERSGVGCREV